MMYGAVSLSISRDDLYWLAGLLEGEGCFGIRSAGATLSVRLAMNDLDVVQRAASLMGTRVLNAKTPKGKRTYTTTLNGKRARELMLELLPLMGQRRSATIRESIKRWEQYTTRPYKWTKLRPDDRYAVRQLHNKGVSIELLARMWQKSSNGIRYVLKGSR